MISLFDKELLDMEHEVRDLKTIHQRGLGTTRFYRASVTKQNASAGSHSFQIHLADGELTPAIILASINAPTPTGASNVSLYERSYGALASVYIQNAGTIRLDVVSSADISEITQ